MLEQSLEALTYEGELYGLPLSFNVIALVCNGALVKTPPANFVELIALGRRLNATKGIVPLLYDNRNFYYHAPFFFGYGASLFDRDGKCVVDSRESIASVEFSMGLERDGIVAPRANHSAVLNLFCSGRVAMVITGPWDLERMKSCGIDVKVAPIPRLARGELARPFLGVKAIALTSFSRHPNEARAFMQHLVSTSAQSRAMEELSLLPCAIEVYESRAVDGNSDAFLRQAKRSVAMPNGEEMAEVWQQMNWALDRCFAREEEPEFFLQQVSNLIDAHISRRKGRMP